MPTITSMNTLPDMRALNPALQQQPMTPSTQAASSPATELVPDNKANAASVQMPTSVSVANDETVTEKDVDSMISTLNTQLEINASNLRFQRDEDLGKMVLGIYDATTDELIRQVPSESLLALSKQIGNYLDALDNLSSSADLPPGSLFDRLV